ncbi:MAG: hypothetical protein IIB55_07550, partial [Planctomycetes bacterium]|nr:hypothetical protein [Planctomycetota bacterium]
MSGKRAIVGLVLCVVAPVSAQVIDADSSVGATDARQPVQPSPEALGDPVAGPFDLATQGESGQLGVVNAWGSYWVTSRSLSQPNHRVLKFTRDGTFV